MAESKSLLVQNLLSRPEIHFQWEGDYRTVDNEEFYERVFDHFIAVLDPLPGTTFLDAGCGPCAHSVRLARRGFNVHSTDFSPSALAMARDYIESRGFGDQITLAKENLMEFSFPSLSFDYVLCWGVLMHIPDVGQAVSELARVLKPGGSLIISESNRSSLEAVTVRSLRRLLGKEKSDVKDEPEGVEYWKVKDGEALITRQANISWLIRAFEARGLVLHRRIPGQFSESYTRFEAEPLRKLVHKINKFWFEHLKWAGPAFGNILIFRKAL
jgi:ubiquinone/menaquinone biosynthesis C-methylase UbiE